MTHMGTTIEGVFYGLTKREFFAGLICACACANPEIEASAERIVADSVAVADELINRLNKQEDAS